MKKFVLGLLACACAFFVMADQGRCDKPKSDCPAKKSCGQKGKDTKGGCPKNPKDGKGQKT